MNGIDHKPRNPSMDRAYTLLATLLQRSRPMRASERPLPDCTGDYVCGEDPSVVATWPLERWTTVRRADPQEFDGPQPSSRSPQLASSGRLPTPSP